MSIKVNGIDKSTEHNIREYCAFIDVDGDFYLIDTDKRYASRITHSGCAIYSIEGLYTIEEFLDCEMDCRLLKAFKNGNEYEIIVNG